MSETFDHIEVMPDEVLAALVPEPGQIALDATIGGAGHAVRLAKKLGPTGCLVGIDQDDTAIAAASARLAREVPDIPVRLVKSNFSHLDGTLVLAEVPGLDCILFDLGVSSPQLDDPERGFSYREDAPLNMAMDPGNHTLTAFEVVNTYTEADLARILRLYGDERYARRIARAIVRRRAEAPIETTLQLAEVVRGAIPAAARRGGHHPARKTFQAIRMEVNGELDALDRGLRAAIRWANPGGRIAVLTYHSGEDRLVSHIFSELSHDPTPPDFPVPVSEGAPVLEVLTRRPLSPSAEEVAANPRARSAHLRVARRLDASRNPGSPGTRPVPYAHT